jgi:integrase
VKKENDRGRKGFRLQLRHKGLRKNLWLGNCSQTAANTIDRHVRELIQAESLNVPPSPETAKWLSGLEGRLRKRLEDWGLARGNANNKLAAFITSYIDGRTDIKPTTRRNYGQTERLLNEFFVDKLLKDISKADSDRWRRWLIARPMAPASVSKHIKRAKTIFAEAVRDGVLYESPFAEQKGSSEANKSRQHFINRETTKTILESLEGPWLALFALARFGGLRCPSEVTRLKWSDIGERIRIDSPKTGLRYCPLFPELRAALNEVERIGERVVEPLSIDGNLGTQFKRLLSVPAWPKLFNNLRSTRRTELQEMFPSHVVDAWLGHSSKTAEDHYLQVTEEHWNGGCTGGYISTNQGPSGAPLMAPDGLFSTIYGKIVTPMGIEPMLPP